MASPFPFAFFTSFVARPVAWGLSLTLALAAAWLSGAYMAAVFTGRPGLLSPALDPLARRLQRIAGPQAQDSMRWSQAALAALSFSCLLFVLVYGVLTTEGHDAAQAFALAARAVTGDPTGLSGRLAGAAFVGAGATLALCVVTLRALCNPDGGVGNYWRDLIRALICVLTPLACLHMVLISSTGVAAFLDGWRGVGIPDPDRAATQILRAAASDAVTGFAALIAPASLVSLFAHMGGRRWFGVIACAAALVLTCAAQALPVFEAPVFLALPWLTALTQLAIHFWLTIPALALAASSRWRRARPAGAQL
jgi:K+-transporting ATPase A subunit